MTAALDLYAAGLAALQEPLVAHYADGRTRVLPVGDWVREQLPGDVGLVARCAGATIDLGCGPGRLTVAVARRGLPALGVDIAPAAIRMALRRGALALPRSVFDTLPGHGRWRTALLADGNVGIGGDPVALLHRSGALLSARGRLLVEVDPPGHPSGAVQVRVQHATTCSDWFPWAHLSVDDAGAAAAQAGLALGDSWEEAGRWFVALART